MMGCRPPFSRVLLVCCAVACAPPTAAGQAPGGAGGNAVEAAAALPQPAAPLPPEHFARQRDRLRAAMGGGVALLRSAPEPRDMGAYVQDQDFLWLTGVAEPKTEVLIGAGGLAAVDELLVPPHSPFTATWQGAALAPGAASAAQTGFATVGNSRALERRLDELLADDGQGAPVLWLRLSPGAIIGSTPGHAAGLAAARSRDPFDGRASREAALRSVIAAKYPDVELRDLTPLLHELRARKTAEEVALLRRSAEVAAAAIAEAMRSTRPGIREFQIAAVARYVLSLHGCGPDAYGAIVGAGENGCVLHYMHNDAVAQDGDLIVMDYAATVHGYASDVTRTFPANGVFTPRQRELVEDVHAIQQALIAEVRPGARLSLISGICSRMLRDKGYRVDHGPCHHVGLAVHDPSVDVLEPGMVITVEPGAYLRDEGMGCRIEDTVLVTADGCEVLSVGVPSRPDAIEALMRQPGIAAVPVGLPR